MMTVRLVFLVATLVTSGCASSGSSAPPDDAIEISMRDNRFDPSNVTVKRNATVTFLFVNRGSLDHEAFIGDSKEQKAHERAMGADGEMSDHGHMAADDSVTVRPGKRATLEHRFTKAGKTWIGCHEPGHYDAGMRIEVTVT